MSSQNNVSYEHHHTQSIYRTWCRTLFIELIEKCPCNDKDELRKKEGEYIRLLNPPLNARIEGRTKKEYYIDNKEHFSQVAKEYYNDNKKQISQKHKDYHIDNQEYIREHRKQYYENNKEDIKDKNKQYKENNKEYLKSYSGEKITCECGCIVTRGHLPRHKRSAKHDQLMI